MSMTGYAQACAAHSGGINTIYFCKKSDLTSFTLASSQDYYDTVTMASSNVFTSYEFDTDSAELRITPVFENGSAKFTSELEFNLGRMSKEVRTVFQELMDESACGMIAIVVDANGAMVVLGYSETHAKARPLRITNGGAVNTGKALTDANGNVVYMGCESVDYPHYFTGTVPV